MSENNPALRLIDLQYHIPLYEGLLRRKSGRIRIIDGISLDVPPGETVAIVGEKGSGKTTLGRTIIQLLKPTNGQVLFNGTNLAKLKSGALRQQRQKLQMVFQDPYTALNPRMTIGELLAEPLEIHRQGTEAERQERVRSLLHLVGLNGYVARHYPHEVAGGSRQRASIARA
ncbi:MAG: ATP-binding cassette domain-containing protein, partial [Candidatus Thermofonsia bacterium]